MSNLLTYQTGPYSETVKVKRNLRLAYWLSAALLLLTLQLATGTEPLYALMVFVFAILTYIAVKSVGGLYTVMGCAIFYLALQQVLISQAAKVYFRQPGDSLLLRPVETILVYNVAMAGMIAAGFCFTKMGFPKRKPLFHNECDPQRLMWLSIITIFCATVQTVYDGLAGVNANGSGNIGGLRSMVHAFVFLTPLSISTTTAYTIIASKGRRSIGWFNGIAMFIPFVFGIISSVRAGMAAVVLIYYITCLAFGFRFRAVHFIVLLCGIYLAQFVLFPYAIYARAFTRSGHFEKNVDKAIDLLGDVILNPGKYKELETRRYDRKFTKFFYFGKPYPTLDRMSMIILTDKFVDVTEMQGTTGMYTISPAFVFAVPRIFYPEKPFFSATTRLAHRVPGMVGKNDKTTGVSNSFIADSFSSYSWVGAFVIPFMIALSYLVLYRLMFSHLLSRNILALSLVWHFMYYYSEGPIAAQIGEVSENVFLFFLGVLIMYRLVDFATLLQRRLRATRLRSYLGRRPILSETENASAA